MTQTLLQFFQHWSFDKNDITHVTSEEAVASFLSQELKTMETSDTSNAKSRAGKIMEYFALMTEPPGHIFSRPLAFCKKAVERG